MWKEETNTDSELQNAGRWIRHFLIFFECTYGYRDNSAKILHSYQRYWLISSHRLHRSLSSFLIPNSDCSGYLTLCSRVSLLTDWFGVSLLIDFILPPLFRLVGFRRHSSLCCLRAKIDKGISRHSGAASKMLKMIPPATHNTQRPTHTATYIHPYIYIYIYIYTHTHYCATLFLPV